MHSLIAKNFIIAWISNPLLFPEYVHITELARISTKAGTTNFAVTFVVLFSIPRNLLSVLRNLLPGLLVCCSYLKVFGWEGKLRRWLSYRSSIMKFWKSEGWKDLFRIFFLSFQLFTKVYKDRNGGRSRQDKPLKDL